MKLFNVFIKNMKVVSRNWVYFLVLFIFPILLIIVAGIMLNSNDFENIRIGMINQDPEYYLDVGDFKNAYQYQSLDECLFYLTNHELSACIHVKKGGDGHVVDVYLDNTQKVVEYFSRQFILERLLQDQFGILQQTSYQISEQLRVYSSSIREARGDLLDARDELEEQEDLLVNYRSELSTFRSDFNSIYFELKAVEPDIQNMKNAVKNGGDVNIEYLRQDVAYAKGQLSLLRSFLSTRLVPDDYNYALDRIENVEDTLDRIDDALDEMKGAGSSAEVSEALDSIDRAISELDEIKLKLDTLDSDLSNAITQTRSSIVKVNEFVNKLDDAQGDIDDFNDNLGSNFISMNFKRAFEIPDDPVLISFPQLITIIIAFSSLVLSNKFVSNMVRKPSYKREIITPTGDSTYVIADYLINLLFIFIQVFVLFVLGLYWFGVPITALPTFLISTMVTASVLIFAGMSLGYLIRTESISMLSTIFLVMFLFIFSDLLMPSVLTGPVIKFFINLNPFVILNNILTDIVLLHKAAIGIGQMGVKLGILLFSSGIIAYLSKKASREDMTQ
jgi:hypothetical protein